MAKEGIRDGFLPYIPNFDVVVDAAREQLVSGFCKADSGYGEIGGDERYGGFCPSIPKLSTQSEQSKKRVSYLLTPI